VSAPFGRTIPCAPVTFTLNLIVVAVSNSESLLKRYEAGERSFIELDLDDQVYDFAGATLDGVDFSETFIYANFRGASLVGAKFERANVKTCDFRDANLTRASFQGAAIDGAEFAGADLSGASFAGATEQGHIYGVKELPRSHEA
jgi:uncharacterized protein YjbI with pentapeptide repeats